MYLGAVGSRGERDGLRGYLGGRYWVLLFPRCF